MSIRITESLPETSLANAGDLILPRGAAAQKAVVLQQRFVRREYLTR